MDAAYESKCRRLAAKDNPDMLLMNYDLRRLVVANLMVVLKHFFTPTSSSSARRSAPRRGGGVGRVQHPAERGPRCRAHLHRPRRRPHPALVRERWDRTLFLRDKGLEARGCLVEVMRCVDHIGRGEFDLAEVYAFEDHLGRLYPGNRNVRPKIRQQLQVLRDSGYLEFAGRGQYRVRGS